MANVVLKDLTGTEHTYNGVSSISVPTAEGSTQNYIVPTGNINLTDANSTDVSSYATAQVVDADLVAGNIKKDVNILGVTGTLEEGITPTGALSITENGTYDVTNYASANVNVSASVKGALCFTAVTAGSTVRLSVTGSLPHLAFEYSTDEENWSNYTIGSTLTLTSIGDKIYFRGDNGFISTGVYNYAKFSMSGRIAASGNIQSLVDKTLHQKAAASGCYYYMFYGCTSLTTAPALPATTLASSCYSYMFYGCTSLTTAPALPATTLAGSCCFYMFGGCASLTTAPALPATTLASSCYYYMFYGCTSLTTAPALPATTLASSCYSYMFQGCTSLTTAPALPATTLASSCCFYMFYGCTSLTTAPALPATTLASSCYSYMFYGCTSLTTAPALPATTLAGYCYSYMFYGCTSLLVYSSSGEGHDKAWPIPTSGTASSYTSQGYMFDGTTGDYATAGSVALNATFYTQNTPVS